MTLHQSSFIPDAAASPGFVPPLEPGDRLTRAGFERRYAAMPHLKKAELIEGIVYIPAPVRLKQHGEPQCPFREPQCGRCD